MTGAVKMFTSSDQQLHHGSTHLVAASLPIHFWFLTIVQTVACNMISVDASYVRLTMIGTIPSKPTCFPLGYFTHLFISTRAKIRTGTKGFELGNSLLPRCLFRFFSGDITNLETGFLKSNLLVKVRLLLELTSSLLLSYVLKIDRHTNSSSPLHCLQMIFRP